jgi:hypothetical protein
MLLELKSRVGESRLIFLVIRDQKLIIPNLKKVVPSHHVSLNDIPWSTSFTCMLRMQELDLSHLLTWNTCRNGSQGQGGRQMWANRGLCLGVNWWRLYICGSENLIFFFSIYILINVMSKNLNFWECDLTDYV